MIQMIMRVAAYTFPSFLGQPSRLAKNEVPATTTWINMPCKLVYGTHVHTIQLWCRTRRLPHSNKPFEPGEGEPSLPNKV